MAGDYALALQDALVIALKADIGVSGLVGMRVYDQPPKPVTRPYIRIGTIIARPVRSDCGSAASLTFSIETHSRPVTSGRVEATRCGAAVVAAIDGAALAVAGFTTVQLHWLTQTVAQDADGEGYTAIDAFSILLDG